MKLAPAALVAALCAWGPRGAVAGHACEAEVTAACPDRPPSELAACLKNPEEHETVTTLSSECTDFVALNIACADDITKFCDEAFFSEDTTLCLKTWTDPESISPKCTGVMSWALPSGEDSGEEDEGPTDELGMSDKDRAEKKEWQEKRRSARGEAIAKMKEEDSAKEKERVELEMFKREHPEEYQQMIEQKEEEERQRQAQKKRERLAAAAMARKKQLESGKGEDDEEAEKDKEEPEEERPKKRKGGGKRAAPSGAGSRKQGGVLPAFLGLLLVATVLSVGYYLVKSFSGKSHKKNVRKPKRKGA